MNTDSGDHEHLFAPDWRMVTNLTASWWVVATDSW
jgi:hypothetical protein